MQVKTALKIQQMGRAKATWCFIWVARIKGTNIASLHSYEVEAQPQIYGSAAELFPVKNRRDD